jgi:hypothetical protein
LKIIKLFLFVFIVFSVSFAKNNLVGSYTNHTVDTISYLAVLPDNKFCFSYTGGNLDLLLAGNWKAQGNNIILEEVRQSQDMYIVVPGIKLGSKQRIINFAGRTLSYGDGTIFGVSSDDKLPKDMRLVLEDGYNGFEEDYVLPLDNDVNKTIFVGLPVKHFVNNEAEYKIYEFKFNTPNANSFRVFFNRDAIRHNFELNATFKNNKLIPDGAINSYDGFTKDNESLDKKSIAKIKQNCIDPVFAQKTNSNNSILKPTKVFNIIMKKPTKFYFKMDDEYAEPAEVAKEFSIYKN